MISGSAQVVVLFRMITQHSAQFLTSFLLLRALSPKVLFRHEYIW